MVARIVAENPSGTVAGKEKGQGKTHGNILLVCILVFFIFNIK